MFNTDGKSYSGYWVNDKILSEKDVFQKEEMKEDRNEFKGSQFNKSAVLISGEKKDGQGVFKWSDGSVYVGDIIDGKMHGQGTFIWPNKNKYDGSWVRNRI